MNTSLITVLSAGDLPGRIIGFDMQLLTDLGLQLISTLIIVIALYWILHKPVSEMLEKRKLGIAKDINEAKLANQAADKLKNDYESKLVGIEDEAAKILKDARATALARQEQMLVEAKKDIEAMKAKAANDILLEQEKVKDEMKSQMIDVSTLMASKFVTLSIDESKHQEIINDIIKEMGDVQWLS